MISKVSLVEWDAFALLLQSYLDSNCKLPGCKTVFYMFEGVPNERHEKVVISQIIMEDGHQPPPPPLHKSGLGQKLLRVVYESYNKERIQLGGLTTAAASGLFSSPLVPSIKKLFFSREICGKNNGLIHQKDYFLIHLERGFRGQKYRP